MKAIVHVTLCIYLLCTGCAHSPEVDHLPSSTLSNTYSLQSQFLVDSTYPVQFVQNCADFWLKAKDPIHGGFYSFVDQTGSPTDSKKWMVGQSRLAYAFTRAFMLTGDPLYLEYAEHALAFLYRYGWDTQYGGWFEMSEANGEPLGRYANKWSFVQHYALLGPSAMCEATRKKDHCGWLEKGLDHNNQKLWDKHAGGYFDLADVDFSNPEGKGFTPTVDAITTHALAAYLLWQRPEHGQRLRALGDDITEHLVATIALKETDFGFVDYFHSDWTIDTGIKMGSVGHMLKAAWALLRLHNLESNPQYLNAAQLLLDHVLNDGGFDHHFGAPNSDYRWDEGVIDSKKEYWQIEQGFTAGIAGYYATQDPIQRQKYLYMADRSLQFFIQTMIDPINGEIFSTASGETGEVLNKEKGGRWKSGYHSTETGYYAYLYGNLFVNQKPATLYYRFDKNSHARQYRLLPISINEQHLHIDNVRLNGERYDHFDAGQQILFVPAHIGGIFEVTYRLISVTH